MKTTIIKIMKTSIIFVLTLLIAISSVAAFRFRQGGGPPGGDMSGPPGGNGTDSSAWDTSSDGGCGGMHGGNGTDYSYDGTDMGAGNYSGDFDPSSMNMSGPPPDMNGTVSRRRMQTFRRLQTLRQ